MDNLIEKLDEAQARLDEISKKTLGRYIKAASGDAVTKSMFGLNNAENKAERKEVHRKINNREYGVNKAVNRLTKEEAEGLEEVSKPMLGRYVNKAKDSIDTTSWRQGYKEAGAGNPSGSLEKKLTKRHKGIETAVKKLTKEDVSLEEQADELYEISKGTLNSYAAKASETLKGRGRKSTKQVKRASSVELAKDKLGKILEKEHLAKEKKHFAKVTEVHNHFQKESKNLLTKHGYTQVHAAADHVVYHKGHENGHSTVIRINENPNKHPYDSHGSKYSVHTTDGSGTMMGHNHTVNHRDDVETNKTEAVHKFHDNLIRADKSGKERNIYESVEEVGNVLTEGRGRPPKDPAKNASDVGEPKMHIIAQLNKVKDSSVPVKVQFKDGSKHEVHSGHAEKILSKYSGLKPNEKINFQQKVASSHASFQSELK